MNDEFDLPVEYNGAQLVFTIKLIDLGYVHKFILDVNGDQLYIEKDDEGNYRAVLADPSSESKIDKGLIKAIVESLQESLK